MWGSKQADSFAAILGNPSSGAGAGWFANSGKYDGLRFTLAARYSADSGYPVPTLPYPIGTVDQSVPPKGHLLWHFDAANAYSDTTGLTLCNEGDTVALWKNKGKPGMRENAVQNTAARRPTFHTGGLNGKPYLQCDRTTQQYFENLDIYENGTSIDAYCRSIFVVAEDIDAASSPAIFGVSGSAQRGAFYLRPTADQEIMRCFRNSGPATVPTRSSPVSRRATSAGAT